MCYLRTSDIIDASLMLAVLLIKDIAKMCPFPQMTKKHLIDLIFTICLSIRLNVTFFDKVQSHAKVGKWPLHDNPGASHNC